jgi:aminocarboxymuconate-semialdehyde decarboxylase
MAARRHVRTEKSMHTTRRDFLQTAAATGIAVAGCGWAHAQRAPAASRGPVSVGGRRVTTVDMHAHILIPEVWPLLEGYERAENDIGAFLRSPMAQNLISVERRLDEMERQGIDIQLLTVHFQHQHDWADRELAAAIVRVLNEKMAEQVEAHPDRLIGLGAVSLQHPDLAAEQLTRAMRELGLKGVMMTTIIGDEEISAERFRPFWTRAEELGAVVFIHPEGFPGGSRFAGSGALGNTIGMPLDTSVALSHMIFSGFLDRHPGIKIVASHGGGYLPSYIGRSDNCFVRNPACQGMDKTPSEYLRQLYYDTLVYSPENLRHLIDVVGADRVVLGTDYPFPIASQDPIGDALAVEGLSDRELEAILGGTALSLLDV